MDIDSIKIYIKEREDFQEVTEVLKACVDKLRDFCDDKDVDFQRYLGEIVSLSLPKDRRYDDNYKIRQMELIYSFQYNQCSSFEKGLIDLFYKSSKNNIGLLSIAYPFEAEAFIKYGRENVNILKMEIEKYRENKVNANNSLNENELNFNER